MDEIPQERSQPWLPREPPNSPSITGPLCEEPSQRGPPKRLEVCPPHHGRAPALSLLAWTGGTQQASRCWCRCRQRAKGRKSQHEGKGCSKNGHGNLPLCQPVPASGHHNAGNRNFTLRQAGPTKNLHKACVSVAPAKTWSQRSDGSDSPDFEVTPSCFQAALQVPAKF